MKICTLKATQKPDQIVKKDNSRTYEEGAADDDTPMSDIFSLYEARSAPPSVRIRQVKWSKEKSQSFHHHL